MIDSVLRSPLFDLQYFAEQGGIIIWVLFGVCALMWALILERIWFFQVSFHGRSKKLQSSWFARSERHSWRAHKIRETLLSQARLELTSLLSTIKTLIMLCPLLGLLGTVTGMVSVFEVISLAGTSDAQAMAQGVYRATLPTMAGLVVAISGLYFSSQLNSWAERKADTLGDSLAMDSVNAHGR